MSKTVWYITKYFSPKTPASPGGRSWFLMKELADAGYQPVVITSDSNNLVDLPDLTSSVTEEIVDGVRFIWLKTLKYQVAKSVKRIVSWFDFERKLFFLRKNKLPKPDVIVVSSLSLLTILNGIHLKNKYKCRLVFEVRDIWPLTIVEEGGFSYQNPFVKFLSFVERLGYEKSDLIIGTMPNLKEHVAQVSRVEKPVVCVPMGVSKEHMSEKCDLDADYVTKYLSSNKVKVVHAGTIGITNALDVFFEAAERLQNDQTIEFIIVGDGALKEFYVEKYGHLDNLIFAPKVHRNAVQEVLRHCELVFFSVYPSRVWDYGQSLNKIIDYMLSGKPVVASYSGYPSMINEAGCGSLLPAGDVCSLVKEIIRYARMTPSEREVIGQSGKDWLLANRNYKKLADEFAFAVFGEGG